MDEIMSDKFLPCRISVTYLYSILMQNILEIKKATIEVCEALAAFSWSAKTFWLFTKNEFTRYKMKLFDECEISSRFF
jgi:hypothetical protein